MNSSIPAVIVPVMRNFDGFTKLMASIKEPIHPFVVDNYNGNRGVAAGWNHGIKLAQEAGYEKFIIINDDIQFREGQPSWLVNSLENHDIVMTEVSYSCFGLSQSCIDKIGYFDENFYPAYWEDGDYSLRVRFSDVRETSNIHVHLDHATSSTQYYHGESEEHLVVSHQQFRNNKAYFEAKWGNLETQEFYSVPFNGEPMENFLHLINER